MSHSKVDMFIAGLETGRVVDRWQLIDSASKEHKRVVLLFGEEFGRRVWMRGYYFKGTDGSEGWVTTIIYSEPDDDWSGCGPTPTHWMPLPPVPIRAR